ncbi:MAG: biotin/lipoyl-containing protein, partial [Arenicellales bacterium]
MSETLYTVNVPDIGDFEDVDIIEVLVKSGDAVDVETPLITLDSDKATMDIPSPVTGTVADVLVTQGVKVSKGDAVATVTLRASSEPKAAEISNSGEDNSNAATTVQTGSTSVPAADSA